MQFKNPDFLYFLLFLIIPIIIHLFQLRRFKKVPFTNVAFLKNLSIKNRKSSQLKKWLVLCTRLLLLAAIVLAFAQPFFGKVNVDTKEHLFIYLDNSLSTDTKGSKGNLLKTASQDLMENVSDKNTYSFLTNSNFYQKINGNRLKEELKKIKHTSKNTSIEDIALKITSLKNTSDNILISDFQNIDKKVFTDLKQQLSLVQILPEQKNNISVDSVFINQNTVNSFTINAIVNNQGIAKENIPIAIYNNNKLLSKQTFSVAENQKKTIAFLVEKTTSFLGRVQINSNDAYDFDNSFYFSLNANEKVQVLAIGENSDYLQRIYTNDAFNFTNTKLQNTNYNSINKQQLIILNELKSIPTSLTTSLHLFLKNGGHLIVIPNEELDINSYNSFFKNITIGKILHKKKDSLKITSINFKHPLFKNVFDKQVRNFQYPYASLSFNTKLKNENNIISFENNTSFLKQVKVFNSNFYWFSSPLNKSKSNFTNSPLIVPVFYNIAQQSLQLSQLYYTVNKRNTIEINTQLNKDAILKLKNEEHSFIPLQNTFQSKVQLITEEKPENNGFYSVIKDTEPIQTISYNIPSNESVLNFLNTKELVSKQQNITVTNSLKDSLQKITSKNKVHWLWKWFLALAIVSLLLEILILKYFKV